MAQVKRGYRFVPQLQPGTSAWVFIIVDRENGTAIVSEKMTIWVGDRAAAEKRAAELNAADWLAAFEATLR